MKLALVKILMKYNVRKSSTTPQVLEFKENFVVRRPKFGISCILEKRENFDEI